MIDRQRLMVPFKPEFLIAPVIVKDHIVGDVDIELCATRGGFNLASREVGFSADGNKEVSALYHPYDSLPSNYSGVAFKIFQGGPMCAAYVELKASPAKILQGHNVYGSTVILTGFKEMWFTLCESVEPAFIEMLDLENARMGDMDCTFSAVLPNLHVGKQVINYLKNISSGHMRAAVQKNEHETTCYFTRGSRHADKKAYLKGPELEHEIKEMKAKAKKEPCRYEPLLHVLEDPDLQEFASNRIRFEGRCMDRMFRRLGIPTNIFPRVSPVTGKHFIGLIDYQEDYEKDGKCLIEHIWMEMFKPLLDSLKGQTMNVYTDDQVRHKLRDIYYRVTPKGNVTYSKADRVFGFYRRLVNEGYQSVKDTMAPRSFYNNLNLLLDAGFSKAQLQNLHGSETNVVPLLQVIDIDFSNQRPGDYKEPISRFDMQVA